MFAYYKAKITSLRSYSFSTLRADLVSGLIVSLVALPLAMSFAIAIGVKPEYGLYAAIFGGLVAAIFGGSEFNVTGPTGAFIAILATVVVRFGYEKLLLAGLFAGIILVIIGIFRFGKLIEFIPYPVTLGFTSGIAVIIFSTQLGNIFGLVGIERHEYFHENIMEIARHLQNALMPAIFIAIVTILIMVLVPKKFPKAPAALLGVVVSSLIVYFIKLDIPTISSVFGGIPRKLPAFSFPKFSFHDVKAILPASFSIVALGSIESLLSCVVSDGMTRKKHNSNAELVGQGLANMIVPFFGGIPVTGAIARTAVNVKSGAATRLSAVFHSIYLALMMLLFAPFVSFIPLASLGGVLAVVSYRMSEAKHVKELFSHADPQDKAVLAITLILTVFTDLTLSIPIGLGLAAILFIRRMSELKVESTVINRDLGEPKFVPSSGQTRCPHIEIYTIEGPLFFGAARSMLTALTGSFHARALIIRLKHVSLIDSTGLSALRDIIIHHNGYRNLYISGATPYVLDKLQKSDVVKLLGENRVFDHTRGAINQALRDQDFAKTCCEYSVVE